MDGYKIFSIEVRGVCQATEGSLSQGFSTVAVLALSPDIPLSAIAHELVHSIQSSGTWRVRLTVRFLIFFAVLRIRDIYPGSRIQKQQQKRGEKKNVLSYLFLYPQISQNLIFYF
jgi:hypothetical protein